MIFFSYIFWEKICYCFCFPPQADTGRQSSKVIPVSFTRSSCPGIWKYFLTKIVIISLVKSYKYICLTPAIVLKQLFKAQRSLITSPSCRTIQHVQCLLLDFLLLYNNPVPTGVVLKKREKMHKYSALWYTVSRIRWIFADYCFRKSLLQSLDMIFWIYSYRRHMKRICIYGIVS